MSLKSMFLDNDGTVNPAHVIAFILVGASIFWVTYVVLKTRSLPDLTGVAYLLGGSGAMNIAHKAEDIIDKFKKKDPDSVPDSPPATPASQ